jgi:DNA polymerase-3 subunit epsilon/ATP-dependent DNA helicase DinG
MTGTYVALDLETTGLDPERDAIIEIGAVKFHDHRVLGEHSTFVNPGRVIPLPVSDLTGIRDEDVADAPSLHRVLPDLVRFVGDCTVVGHSVGFDLAFLRKHGALQHNPSLDTFELAGVLLPEAERYSLGELVATLGAESPATHRALADAQSTRVLFAGLLDRASRLPPDVLQEIAAHAARSNWQAARFFEEALRVLALRPRSRRAPEPREALGDAAAIYTWRDVQPLEPCEPRTALDVDSLALLLEREGAFAATFDGYEHRPQQVAMLRRVAQAFDRGEHLIVEAPTGVGKSLAYLIPAVRWAYQNGERTVVSTNTINLQEQLHTKDVPTLSSLMPFEFRATVLKGRSHYLCPARLRAMRRRGVHSPVEAKVLAKVLVWLQATRDGDGDDVFLPGPVEQSIWRRLSADFEGCRPDRCRVNSAGGCFYYRARRRAEASHLVIVNHALLLADIAVQNRALPDYAHLVVDEAHHLEGATTNGLSVAVDRLDLRRTLSEIGSVSSSGRVDGLLAQVLGACREAGLDGSGMDRLELHVGRSGLAIDRLREGLDRFFDRLDEFVEEHSEGQSGRYGLQMRVTSGLRAQPAWDLVEIAWESAGAALRAVVRELDHLALALDALPELGDTDGEATVALIEGAARRLAEAGAHLDQVVSNPDNMMVYWLASNGRERQIGLHAAPLHVGPLIEEHLFLKKRTMVLTSATLRTAGTFEYIRERLNAWDAEELAVGSPFDYASSTLLYLVDDVPEPGQPGHQREVAQAMQALFRATGGRALALFTSYNQLRATLRTLRAPLAQHGITVQAQGEGVSRRRLLENFRSGDRRVLLGTRSFWEGVDVPGEALSCLAIAKLPFSVPTDPVFAARSETYESPFLEYAVPEAILRFLQGFGRLIRTRTDRGVVAVFDRRLLTRQYGRLFIESLPGPTVRRGSALTLPRAAADWLDR